ncbi:hypothetical protein F4815DRAFT_450616 [Daldinia loculata]|nr:hypothetical protein F4815DRAFT_450616 [Daldinia loculata]
MGLISGFTSARRLRISTTALPVESGESRIAGALVSIIFVGVTLCIDHKQINETIENRLEADPGDTCAKVFYLDLESLSPVVAVPNSFKVTNTLNKLESQNIALDKTFLDLVSCTNSRSSNLAQSKVFCEAAKVSPNIKFYVTAASVAK